MTTRGTPTAPAATGGGRPIHVLVVDDSAVVRQVMSAILGGAGMRVTAAPDPIYALQKMERERPDVIVLDLEMPRMDGMTFLRRVMAEDPLPVVVCSSLAARGSETALQALDEGAVEVIGKPQLGVGAFLEQSRVTVVDAVCGAALARIGRRGSRGVTVSASRAAPLATTTDKVVAIGASTGGTDAIREILTAMPPDAPGIVIVQHMPEHFTRAFAKRMDAICAIEVREAASGDRVTQGKALIAPGNLHTRVRRSGAQYVVDVAGGPFVCRHRPSVDVLFQSVAEAAGRNAVGVLLTGMGEDGADGLLAMHRAGALTLAQDEKSCVVFGMPRAAIERGAVDAVVPLADVASRLLSAARSAFVRR